MNIAKKIKIFAQETHLALWVLLVCMTCISMQTASAGAPMVEKSTNLSTPHAVIITAGGEVVQKFDGGAEVVSFSEKSMEGICTAWGGNALFAEIEATLEGNYTAETAKKAYLAADKAYQKCLHGAGI